MPAPDYGWFIGWFVDIIITETDSLVMCNYSCTQTVTHQTRRCTASLWSWMRLTECWAKTSAGRSMTSKSDTPTVAARASNLPPVTEKGEEQHSLCLTSSNVAKKSWMKLFCSNKFGRKHIINCRSIGTQHVFTCTNTLSDILDGRLHTWNLKRIYLCNFLKITQVHISGFV